MDAGVMNSLDREQLEKGKDHLGLEPTQLRTSQRHSEKSIN